jgi:hypothetical protein
MTGKLDMKWKEFRPGMLVHGEAEDYFQLDESEKPQAISKTEYPFSFFGIIEQITQRRMVIRGVWKWACEEAALTTNEARGGETGIFGIIRGGVLHVSHVQPHRTWLNPIYHEDRDDTQ